MKMTMTDIEAAVFARKERVFHEIKELAARRGFEKELRYWFTGPHKKGDLTIHQQAETLRQLHEEAVIEIIKQDTAWIDFRIIQNRFHEAAAIYDKSAWSLKRAMSAASLQKLIAPTELTTSPTSYSVGGGVRITARKGKPLPPPLDWDDTPYSDDERLVEFVCDRFKEVGTLRLAGFAPLTFTKLPCIVLDFFYNDPQRKTNPKSFEDFITTVGARDDCSKEGFRHTIRDINDRVKGHTGRRYTELIRKDNTQQGWKKTNKYVWAL